MIVWVVNIILLAVVALVLEIVTLVLVVLVMVTDLRGGSFSVSDVDRAERW